MARLLDSISRDEVGDFLWNRVCRRLLLIVPGEQFRESRFLGREFSSRPFRGILSHLSLECGGNPHTQGIGSITASSTEHKFDTCHRVVADDWTDCWTEFFALQTALVDSI
jgi:hypothetical protein